MKLSFQWKKDNSVQLEGGSSDDNANSTDDKSKKKIKLEKNEDDI
jgi:hypothetical protein